MVEETHFHYQDLFVRHETWNYKSWYIFFLMYELALIYFHFFTFLWSLGVLSLT